MYVPDRSRLRRPKVSPIRPDEALIRGLPANLDAERFVLGSILLDDSRFLEVAESIRRDDFMLEKHRRIFARMMELHERGEHIDRVTIANELLRYNELESVDGLSYLISLDDGLPRISNLGSYFAIIREKGVLRRIAFTAQYAMNRALAAEDDPAAILADLSEQAEELGSGLSRRAGLIEDLPAVGEAQADIRYLIEPELPEGAVVALTGDSGSGKSTLATAWARDVIATGRPVLILDRESPATCGNGPHAPARSRRWSASAVGWRMVRSGRTRSGVESCHEVDTRV